MVAGSVTSASLLEVLDQMPPARASDMLASILASATDRLAVLNATDTHERLQTVLVLVQQVKLPVPYAQSEPSWCTLAERMDHASTLH